MSQLIIEASQGLINHEALDKQIRDAYILFWESNKSEFLIKFVVIVSELYEILGRLD